MIVLGFALVVGTLIWFGLSTEDGSLVSKEVTTTEPAGKEAAGQKTVKETNYADTVVIFALTIGAVMALSGAFFGRIREIKIGGAVLSMVEAPKEVADDAKKKAEEEAKKKVSGEAQEEKVAAVAGSLATQQINLAYAMAPPSERSTIAEVVGAAAAETAVQTVNR